MSDMQQGSTQIETYPFDPLAASVHDWAKFHAYRRARLEEDFPGEPAVPDAELERDLRRHDPLTESRRILAVRDGALVGNLTLSFRRDGSPGCEDYASFVYIWGGVLRAHRCQGIGRALVAALLSFMQEQGKTIATMKVHLPESHAFMAAIGATQNYRSIENRLRFDGLDWKELAHWQAQATTPGDGLTWEIHAGRVPFERLAPLMAPFSALLNEQPLDSLDVPRGRYELRGYETWYADMDRRGGEHFLVLLRHGDDVAAMCDASWDARFPDRVYQQLTAVARPWRGKGLAKGVKAAMLKLIRDHHPEVRTMITSNAEVNASMLSINQRLGFAVHRQEGTYQISRETLARFAVRGRRSAVQAGTASDLSSFVLKKRPMTNPILNLDPLPLFDQILPEHIAPALAQLIHDACHTLAIVTAPDFPADWSQIAAIHHTALERLTFTRWGIVWHLSSVAETPALRTAFNAAEPEYAAFWARRNADERLYAKYKAIDPATLNPEQAQAHRNALREFVLGGVELTGVAKVRFKQIQEREAALGQKFEEKVRDATNAWARYVSTHELAGVSEDVLASTAAAAKAEGKDGHKITLWTPGLAPSRALREKLYRARVDACTELFDRPEFDNTGIVAEILALRQERAALLGYRNYAELSLVPKMAESPEQVLRFLRDLAARTRPYAEEKLAELRAFAAEHLGLQDPKPWDWYYIIEKLREARYAFTAQEVKPYFTAPKVLSGLFKMVEMLFEVEIRKSTAPVWHPSVEFYRIERNGALLGQLYVDLSAREGKRDGAWAFPMRSRWLRPDTGSLQTPVVQLVCNFAQGLDGKPPLLTHPEVTLLFHEFGHALHHLLTQVDEIDLAGANGVEFDCTELPSQFMENFCWEWDVLKNMTAHVDTGEPLPRALFDKMLAARNLASFWSLQQRQIESALLDMRLHAEPGSSVQAMVDEVRAEVAVINPPAHTQTPNTFLHIFSYIFAAGFYSYNWSEVLSADAYAAFEETTGEDGTVNMETARRYRQAILETGGSRPASESFKAFRGREPTINAWLRHQGMG